MKDLHHAADYTPYEGLRVTGWPVQIILGGEIAAGHGARQNPQARGSYLSREKSSLCT